MSGFTKEDKTSISLLHGNGMPKSLRDASSSASQGFTRNPTPISMPQNQPRSSYPGNPYSGRTSNNLNGPRHTNHNSRQVGNPNAGRTILGPPSKRKKLEHTFTVVENGLPSHALLHTGQRKKNNNVALAPDTVEISSDEEDMGQLVHVNPRPASSDGLDLIPQSKPSNNRHRLSLDIEQTEHPFDVDDHTGAVDWLKKKVGNARNEDVDDEIQEFAPTKSDPRSKIPLNNTRTKALAFEEVERQPPRLDLRAVGNVKQSMKPKTKPMQTAYVEHDPEMTSMTQFKNSRAAAPKAGPSQVAMLPVRQWILGHKHLEQAYYVTWDKSGKLTIKSGADPAKKSFHTEVLDCRADVESITLSKIPVSREGPVLKIETFPAMRKRSTIGSKYPDLFTQGGPRNKGLITIMFDAGDETWSSSRFDDLTDWLKVHVKETSFATSSAASAIWEGASRYSQLTNAAATRLERNSVSVSSSGSNTKPPPRKRAVSIEDDWEAPLGVMPPRNDADAPSKAAPQSLRERPSIRQHGPASGVSDQVNSVRRSGRQTEVQNKRKSPVLDPEELILVYPPNAPGAVNIKNSDLNRLEDGEFLNDTIIEFGLKLWLKGLEDTNPELASQIHVFNSFFYKKLNKKNVEEGYQSVRRWTSKFDIFSKKMIIVPINENLHWYLAIIYQPGNMLFPPIETKSPVTRRRARVSTNLGPPETSETLDHEVPVATEPLEPLESSAATIADDEEVRDDLLGFKTACTISPPKASSTTTASPEDMQTVFDTAPPGELSSPLTSVADLPENMDVDDDDDELRLKARASPTVSDFNGQHGSRGDSTERGTAFSEGSGEDRRIKFDDTEPIDNEEVSAIIDGLDSSPRRSAVPVTAFYGKASKKDKDKSKAASQREDTRMDVDGEDIEFDDTFTSDIDQPMTHIFTLDSLGSKHLRVINILTQYLKLEAKERKGNENTRKPSGKQAHVPLQPNFCDCGVYLLHFARVFARDHERYSSLIAKPTSRLDPDRNTVWDNTQVAPFRRELKQRIEELSQGWKAAKKLEESNAQATEVVDSSEGEVDIIDTTPATPKGKGKGKAKEATSKSTKPTRLRG